MEVARECGGRVLIVHEAVRTGGFAGDIAMRLHEALGSQSGLFVRRLRTPDVRMPAAPPLQGALIPNADSIVDAARQLVADAAA